MSANLKLPRTVDLKPETWIRESRSYARRYVYTPEVLVAVKAASRGLTDDVRPVSLSDDYFRDAGRLAGVRARMAGIRLARVLADGIDG